MGLSDFERKGIFAEGTASRAAATWSSGQQPPDCQPFQRMNGWSAVGRNHIAAFFAQAAADSTFSAAFHLPAGSMHSDSQAVSLLRA
jgi:hypothetical protein